MIQRWNFSGKLVGAVVLPLIVSCQATDSVAPTGSLSHTVPASLQIPPDVKRLAILHEDARHQDERDAYRQLEGAVFQFKELRPALRIVERSNLAAILGEQRFQLGGPVSEETAMRVGRLLGVDSVLIYDIEGPSLRDRLFAERHGDLPPYLVTSKIVKIESAEVLFHNVVTAPIKGPRGGTKAWFGSESSVRPLMRQALERGVRQTISDLRRAFR